MTQQHLEAFMLMSCEKDILTRIDNEQIIDEVGQTSDLLKKTLIY